MHGIGHSINVKAIFLIQYGSLRIAKMVDIFSRPNACGH